MNISYTITDNGPEDAAFTYLRKLHNTANSTSLTVKQYIETIWLPARIAEQTAGVQAAKTEARSVRDAYLRATAGVKAQVDTLLGL